jgi:hypothetical protein
MFNPGGIGLAVFSGRHLFLRIQLIQQLQELSVFRKVHGKAQPVG